MDDNCDKEIIMRLKGADGHSPSPMPSQVTSDLHRGRRLWPVGSVNWQISGIIYWTLMISPDPDGGLCASCHLNTHRASKVYKSNIYI